MDYVCPELQVCRSNRDADRVFKEKIETTLVELVTAKTVAEAHHNEVTRRLDDITKNQREIIDVLVTVKGLLVDVDHLRKGLEMMDGRIRELFQRMLKVEDTKADEEELSSHIAKLEVSISKVEKNLDAIRDSRVSGLWQVLMMIGAAVFGALSGWIIQRL